MRDELIVEPNLRRPDDFYETLIEAHRDLTPEQSASLNAALILLLANHIGNPDVLSDAIARARIVILENTNANALV